MLPVPFFLMTSCCALLPPGNWPCAPPRTPRNGAGDGFHQNRVVGFPRPTRHSSWPPAVKFAPCEPYVESQVLQRFGADATFTHVELLAQPAEARVSILLYDALDFSTDRDDGGGQTRESLSRVASASAAVTGLDPARTETVSRCL